MSYAHWELGDDAVARITMDRPETLNALSNQLVRDVVAALHEAEADPGVRAAVLTGAGRAFCSGGDLADMGTRVADGEPGPRLDSMRDLHALIVGLRDSRLPIVAAVHGAAYGAGFSTALACDLVVATADARFCQVFVRRNLVPDLGSPWLLPRAVGIHAAKDLMLLGEEISGAEAFRLGIVKSVAATAEEALETAHELAARMAKTIPATMAMAKGLINRSQALTLEDSLRLEEHAQAMALGTPETLAAMRAFLEKTAS
ncbi:MAG: Enoyl-CoA hydratase/isomerase [Conexibacter sp.]|jgi:2-(1,2-epoxy-1,2-dihydrophenyl)acetyl-CoA isomerase|nr:Enoyl-CoA hydratase/isomerase [Conexibacter sp.]